MAPSSRQAPGGTSSICLGDESSQQAKKSQSSNAYATGSNQNCGNVLTDRPSTALKAPPGGVSTICLGTDDSSPAAPKSSNAFANGSNQNSGNVISERSSTGIHAPPGGVSTICLGTDDSSPAAPKSSNAFANGSNQNSGNVISERSSTGIHAPPGGVSTICLGHDSSPAAPMSSNSFASGANQNSGNVLSERSSTGIHAPPGGVSTICLGADVNDWKAESRTFSDQTSVILGAEPSPRVDVGGKDHIVLGAGPVILGVDPVTRAVGGTDQIVFGASEAPRPATGGPAGGPATICLGSTKDEWTTSSSKLVDQTEAVQAQLPMDKVDVGGTDHIVFGKAEEARPVTAGPSGGVATICLGSMKEEWTTTSSKLVDQTEAVQSQLPLAKMDVGGKDHVILGPPPVVLGADPSTCPPIGGKDHIVFGESNTPADQSQGHPVGGEDHIVFGGEASPKKDSSKATVAEEVCHSARIPSGGASTVVLGTCGGAADWKATSADMAGVQNASGECKRRAPPGGAGTIILGATQAEVKKEVANSNVEKTAAGYSQGIDPPTPARAGAARVPPGGAATVLLG